jgi:hypothetical protein
MMSQPNNFSPPNRRIVAHSISRSLLADLSGYPFEGSVVGVLSRAVNLFDKKGRVITLTVPAVGNGPFSIVVETAILFETLQPHQTAHVEADTLSVGSWTIRLSQARIWEPGLNLPKTPLSLTPLVAAIFSPYTAWPRLNQNNPTSQHIARLAGTAATQLNQALQKNVSMAKLSLCSEGIAKSPTLSPDLSIQRERGKKLRTLTKNQGIAGAVSQLAGLGQGLTPAGDDYLVGVMAALWLTGRTEIPPHIADIAALRTTALSAAFLRAAGRGEFIESWQRLAQVLETQDTEAITQVVNEIAGFGASSGVDALAGFATTIMG